MSSFLSALVELWNKQADQAYDAKEKQFGKTAKQVWGFLGKSYRQLYQSAGEDSEDKPFLGQRGQRYKPRINKTRQYINVYLPFLLTSVPNRIATPRRPALPKQIGAWLAATAGEEVVQMRAQLDMLDSLQSYLMSWWLNYLPVEEYDLFRESRTCIPEALAKGRGVVWHEMQPGRFGMVPVTEYDTVDDLYLDPDHKRWRDLGYIIRWRHKPAWQLAEQFGIPVAKIRGARTSHAQKAANAANGRQGQSSNVNDICDYMEVTSRIGLGHRLLSATDAIKDKREALDGIPNAWLAILPGMDHPLNLRPEWFDVDNPDPDAEMMIRQALEWPIPFYENRDDPWPCSVLDYYPNADDPWATSSLEAALPLQAFLDHAYAFLMGRARVSSRQLVLLSEALEEGLVDKIENGGDLEVARFKGTVQDIQKHIYQLKFDDPQDGLFTLIQLAERGFERMTDMDPLLQGAAPQTQMRSAEEAALRGAHINNRPDEFRDITTAWQGRIACKEGIASRLHVTPQTVAPLFGEEIGEDGPDGMPTAMGPLTQAWAQFVNTDDPSEASAEMSYKTEYGPGQRKNKAYRDALTNTLSQQLPAFLQIGMGTGLVQPFNAMLRMIAGEEVEIEELMLPEEQMQQFAAQQQAQAGQQQAQQGAKQ